MPGYILINSQQRSGGSLFARMFDGHENLCVFPHEMRFSRDKDRLPPLEKFKTDDFEAVLSMLNTEGNFRTTKLFSKQQYENHDITFNYENFLVQFKQLWKKDELKSRTMGRAFLAEAEAFFRVVNDGSLWKGEGVIQYFVGHCARSWLIPADKIFKEFPDSYIIQPIRDPRALFASKKQGYSHEEKQSLDIIEMHMTQWIDSIVQGFKNAVRYSNRYSVIKYEDLISDPEGTMRNLSEFIGISFDQVLAEPQYLGSSWMGNSAFGPTHGLDKTRIDSWREKLSEIEISSIEKITGCLMHFLGYSPIFEKRSLSEVTEFIKLFSTSDGLKASQEIEEKIQKNALDREYKLQKIWQGAYNKEASIIKRGLGKIKRTTQSLLTKTISSKEN